MKGHISLKEFIKDVKDDLKSAIDTKSPFFLLEEVELEVSFVLDTSANSKAKLLVVELQGGASAAQTHRVRIKLKPFLEPKTNLIVAGKEEKTGTQSTDSAGDYKGLPVPLYADAKKGRFVGLRNRQKPKSPVFVYLTGGKKSADVPVVFKVKDHVDRRRKQQGNAIIVAGNRDVAPHKRVYERRKRKGDVKFVAAADMGVAKHKFHGARKRGPHHF